LRNVRDILREKGATVYSISPEATVYDALKIMAEKNIGALLVLDEGRLTGIISERDYARKVILMNKFSRETKVSEIMTSDITTVKPATDMDQCMEIITEKRTRHLPVVEKDRVAGIISIGDVVKNVIVHKQFIIDQLESYIKGRTSKRES